MFFNCSVEKNRLHGNQQDCAEFRPSWLWHTIEFKRSISNLEFRLSILKSSIFQSFKFSIFCLFTSGALFQSTLRLYGRVQQKFQLRRVVLINLSYEEYFLSLYFQGLKIIKNVFQFLVCPVFGTVYVIIKSLIVNLLIA